MPTARPSGGEDSRQAMRYSQMSREQRQQWLGDPQSYPLRVSFLGKEGLLSYGEVAFLREHGVDFEVDDAQIAEIEAEQAEEGLAPAPPRGWPLRLGAGLVAALLLLRRRFPPSRER